MQDHPTRTWEESRGLPVHATRFTFRLTHGSLGRAKVRGHCSRTLSNTVTFGENLATL